MMAALFDSRDKTYRAPFGAVAEGTEVLFRICVPRDWGCHAAWLTVEPDGQPTRDVGMFWAGEAADGREWWDVRYTAPSVGLYWYAFRLRCAMGDVYLSRQEDGRARSVQDPAVSRWQLTVYAADFKTPDWLAGGIMYQVFPDRFFASGEPKRDVPTDRVMHTDWRDCPVWRPDADGRVRNNDFFGGDLKGIAQKLDYLVSLGITCLYLNPVFESHSNHRYDTADYTRIDPLLGDESDLRALTAEAKARGMRVILDGVFSHTGADSRYFNREGRYPAEGAFDTLTSPYATWYHFDEWPHRYRSWWGFDTLPEVDETAPDFMRYINGEDGVAVRWIRCGTAGWRLDVADELPDAFLDALRRRVKQTDPDAILIGEVWEDASNKQSYGRRRRYLLGDQLDSVMNYPFRDAILRFMTEGGSRAFRDRVMTVAEHYPPPVLRLLMNHIGTHDTERALTTLGGEPCDRRDRERQARLSMPPDARAVAVERLRAATLLQFALPGVPCVYYGDEAGCEGYADPFNRAPYPWGAEDVALLDWYRRLGACRRDCAALAEGAFLPLDTDEDVAAFVRTDGISGLLCAVNRADTPRAMRLPTAYADGSVVIGDGRLDSGVLFLPPRSGVWIINKK